MTTNNMPETFNLKQLLSFAISRERESEALYKALAEKAKDSSLKALFKELAKQETKHEKFYTYLMETNLPGSAEHAVNENEYTVYMRNIMEEHAASFQITGEHIYSISQALDYAIAREKNAILFYSGLKNYVPANVRSTLNTIIEEEMKHAAILMNVKLKRHIPD